MRLLGSLGLVVQEQAHRPGEQHRAFRRAAGQLVHHTPGQAFAIAERAVQGDLVQGPGLAAGQAAEAENERLPSLRARPAAQGNAAGK